MYETGLSTEVILKIKEIAKNNDKYQFYIFGSRANGTFKKTSDIDIAIFKNVSEKDRFKIMNEFDLIDVIYNIDLVFISENIKKELLVSIQKNKIKVGDLV